MVVGSARRNIPLVEARDISGTVITSDYGMVGAGVEPFYLVFAEDWFADGEVVFGNLNQVYPIRILGDAKLEGTNATYKVELMGGNVNGIPKFCGDVKPSLIDLELLRDNRGQAEKSCSLRD